MPQDEIIEEQVEVGEDQMLSIKYETTPAIVTAAKAAFYQQNDESESAARPEPKYDAEDIVLGSIQYAGVRMVSPNFLQYTWIMKQDETAAAFMCEACRLFVMVVAKCRRPMAITDEWLCGTCVEKNRAGSPERGENQSIIT